MRRGGLNIPTFMQIPPCKLMARLIDQSMAANLAACTYTTLKVADNESEHNEYGIWKADVVSPKCSLALMKISTTMSKDSIGQRTIPMWTTSARSHRLSLSARCGANNNMWIWAVCCRHYRLERLLLLIVAVDYRCRFFLLLTFATSLVCAVDVHCRPLPSSFCAPRKAQLDVAKQMGLK